MLRHEKDAAWRSDVLTAMSDRARWETNTKSGMSESIVLAHAAAPDSTRAPATSPSNDLDFGKPLDFKSNYYRP